MKPPISPLSSKEDEELSFIIVRIFQTRFTWDLFAPTTLCYLASDNLLSFHSACEHLYFPVPLLLLWSTSALLSICSLTNICKHWKLRPTYQRKPVALSFQIKDGKTEKFQGLLMSSSMKYAISFSAVTLVEEIFLIEGFTSRKKHANISKGKIMYWF